MISLKIYFSSQGEARKIKFGQFVKITEKVPLGTPPQEVVNISFELLKVSKMISLKIYFSSQGEARKIKFGQFVKITEKVPLGTPPQEVVMSLAQNHVTNLKLQRSYCYQIWAVKASS